MTWFAVRMPDVHIYTNFPSPAHDTPYVAYEEDITTHVRATGDSVCAIGLRQGQNLLLFAGNTDSRTITTAIGMQDGVSGSYRLRRYDSLFNDWLEDEKLVPAEEVARGMPVKLERKGFCLLDLRQEV